MELSIVVPLYNEEGNIKILYGMIKKTLAEENFRYEIIFVDDGSTDATGKMLKSIADKDSTIKLVKLISNHGLSKALEMGFQKSSGDVIISMDGDLQNDPQDIPRLISRIEEGYDVVCGWRYRRKDPLFKKKIPSVVHNFLLRLLFGMRIHDNGCTLRAYKSDIIKEIRLPAGMHRFIPVLLHLEGFSVTEIKVRHGYRKHGKAKFNSPKRFFDALKNIIKIKLSHHEIR